MKNNELEIRDHHKVIRTVLTLLEKDDSFHETLKAYKHAAEFNLMGNSGPDLLNFIHDLLPEKYFVEKNILSKAIECLNMAPDISTIISKADSGSMKQEVRYYKTIKKSLESCKTQGQIQDTLVKYHLQFEKVVLKPQIASFPLMAFNFCRLGQNFIYNPFRQFRNNHPNFDETELMKADLKGLLVGSVVGIGTLNPSIPISTALIHSLGKAIDMLL